MRIIDRLNKYMDAKGLNDNQVTINCHLSTGLLGKARHGKSDIGKKTIEKILNFYPDINRVWLLTGEGQMLNPPKNDFTQITEEEMGNMIAEGFSDYLMKMYKDGEIYSAEMVKKMIAEKDAKIEELQRRIWELEQTTK